MARFTLAGGEGRIQTGSYQGQDGKRDHTTDVDVESMQFIEQKNGQVSQNNAPKGQPQEHQRRSSEYQQPQADPFTNNNCPVSY